MRGSDLVLGAEASFRSRQRRLNPACETARVKFQKSPFVDAASIKPRLNI
jgi:hypothetical protein